jgi:hypothetical protein
VLAKIEFFTPQILMGAVEEYKKVLAQESRTLQREYVIAKTEVDKLRDSLLFKVDQIRFLNEVLENKTKAQGFVYEAKKKFIINKLLKEADEQSMRAKRAADITDSIMKGDNGRLKALWETGENSWGHLDQWALLALECGNKEALWFIAEDPEYHVTQKQLVVAATRNKDLEIVKFFKPRITHMYTDIPKEETTEEIYNFLNPPPLPPVVEEDGSEPVE